MFHFGPYAKRTDGDSQCAHTYGWEQWGPSSDTVILATHETIGSCAISVMGRSHRKPYHRIGNLDGDLRGLVELEITH
jgi:hypothetical protein